jgi:hypothetical protein
MTKITSLQAIAGTLLALGLSAAPAQALSNRTFVSGKGTDAGSCTLQAPCRGFNFALSQTAAGGEIDVLDPAEYGGHHQVDQHRQWRRGRRGHLGWIRL